MANRTDGADGIDVALAERDEYGSDADLRRATDHAQWTVPRQLELRAVQRPDDVAHALLGDEEPLSRR